MSEKREKTTIKLASHPDFPATNQSALMTSSDLARYTNTLFKSVFDDYSGCKVYIDQFMNSNSDQSQMTASHPVQVELYFALGSSNSDNKKIQAFRPITDTIREQHIGGKMNYIERTMGHNIAITQNKSSEITQEGIDIIGSMLWFEVASRTSMNPTAKEFNNLGIVVEGSTTQGQTPYMTPSTQKIIYNIVKFVDINSILNMLFGATDEDGNPVIYQTAPIKPIIPMQNNTGFIMPNAIEQKWLFNVSRLNQQRMADLCNELGAYNVTNGMNIYTETF